MVISLSIGITQVSAKNSGNETEAKDEAHNWVEYSTEYHEIPVGPHEFTYWKNLMKFKRTCEISHRIKTVIYYCDTHDHTTSEVHLEEIIHSENHPH